MSKHRQIIKTRMLREKRNPERRMLHITELRRSIKAHKEIVKSQKKNVERLERDAWWAKMELTHNINEIARMEKELAEYESYERK